MSMNIPELLAPAGNPEKLKVAVAYGASAVYLSGQRLNLRSAGAGFDRAATLEAIDFAHEHGVKVYYCLNAFPQEDDLHAAKSDLEFIAETRADALIIADPGLFRMARRVAPHIPIHISTQANTCNHSSIDFWQDLGATRVNLAREMDCRAIRRCRKLCPDMELEVFVHGAMCMSLSGRCFLSDWLNQRSANKGQCTHPCRFKYKVKGLAVEESTRPGEVIWECYDEDDYSAIFAAKDLCLLYYLPYLSKIGIDSIKIEGRTKSSIYLAQVLGIYKRALLDIENKRFRPSAYKADLKEMSTRELSTGFFLSRSRTIVEPEKETTVNKVVGLVASDGQSGDYLVQVKNKWLAASDLEIMLPAGEKKCLRSSEYRMVDSQGNILEEANSGTTVNLRCPDLGQVRNLFIKEIRTNS